MPSEILKLATKNDPEPIRKLLEANPDLVHEVDTDGYTPLHRACYSDATDVIRLLIDYGAQPRARTNDGWEPLHCACKWGHIRAASLMINNGGHVNAKTNGNVTPLHLACHTSNLKLIRYLLFHPGSDVGAKNNSGDDAFAIIRRETPYADLVDCFL